MLNIKKNKHSDLLVLDKLVENFCNELMNSQVRKLLELSFKNDVSQAELNELLGKWDRIYSQETKTLLFSYFRKLHPNLIFDDEFEAQLKALVQKYRLNNIAIVSPFIKAGKILNQNGIYPLVLKGLAMRFFRPDLVRIMGDVDFLVRDVDFNKAIEFILPLGYYYEKIDVHSVDLHDKKTGRNAIDIHRFISMGTDDEKRFLGDLFRRSTIQNVFGVRALVPCCEDMMFITLVNLARNLREATSKAGILYSLFDCKYFLESKSNFNWNIVKNNAKITSTLSHIVCAIEFINEISSNIFPEDILKVFDFDSHKEEYSIMVLYKRFYLNDLRTKCRKIKVKDIFKSFDALKRYLALKPKYQILKFLSKHPKLIKMFIKDLESKNYDI